MDGIKHLILMLSFLVPAFCHSEPVYTESGSKFKLRSVYYYVNLPVHFGMFSNLCYVAGVLHDYESGKAQGIEIDFGKSGLYYEEGEGENWWNYYFEPVKEGVRDGAAVRTFSSWDYDSYARKAEQSLSKEEIHRLIRKYFKIRPAINAKVQSFLKRHFGRFPMIGVHYRGTDKANEAPMASYAGVAQVVETYIEDHALAHFKIFVATDEQPFLDYMESRFGDRVIFNAHLRSSNGKPLHYSHVAPRQHGEEALIDCLILSKCHVLIRTSSNLSLWAGYFNPDLPIIQLTKNYR